MQTNTYPFEHTRENMNIGAFLLAGNPDPDDLRALLEIPHTVTDKMQRLYARLAEQIAGFPPLPEPLSE